MREKIGEFLVRNKVLTQDQVALALKAQREGDARLFGEIAVAKGMMEENALRRFADFYPQHASVRTRPTDRDRIEGMAWFG
jgi:hypothetical protein